VVCGGAKRKIVEGASKGVLNYEESKKGKDDDAVCLGNYTKRPELFTSKPSPLRFLEKRTKGAKPRH